MLEHFVMFQTSPLVHHLNSHHHCLNVSICTKVGPMPGWVWGSLCLDKTISASMDLDSRSLAGGKDVRSAWARELNDSWIGFMGRLKGWLWSCPDKRKSIGVEMRSKARDEDAPLLERSLWLLQYKNEEEAKVGWFHDKERQSIRLTCTVLTSIVALIVIDLMRR